MFGILLRSLSHPNSRARQWDDGYPSGGNYWSDHECVDEYSGPSQDIPGSDDICDTPYIIDENNRDHYPLMRPWTLSPATEIIFNPPYAAGMDGLGFADEFGTGKALYYSYVDPSHGIGRVGVDTHVFPGGGYGWAESDIMLSDGWECSVSGQYYVEASFSLSGYMRVFYASTPLGIGYSMAGLKATLSVYDRSDMTKVLQSDLAIFEATVEPPPMWLKGKPNYKRQSYGNTPMSVAGNMNLERGHKYEWRFRIHVFGYSVVSLGGAGIAGGQIKADLNEVCVRPT